MQRKLSEESGFSVMCAKYASVGTHPFTDQVNNWVPYRLCFQHF